MVDFILVTNNAEDFHRENIKWNPSHYSFLRFLLNPKRIAKFQSNYAGKLEDSISFAFLARIYYNTLVKSKNRTMKYGIISSEDLLTDLQDWSWLYTAGRLHKVIYLCKML